MKISTANKTVLVVSDVHQEIDKLAKIIEKEAPDQTVFLGDWFDSFNHDKNEDVIKACQFIKSHVFEKNFKSLFGNHDLPYFFKNHFALCSGYEPRKQKVVTETFGNDLVKIRNQFGWFIWVDDFLCSHAGLHQTHLPAKFPRGVLDDKVLTPWLEGEAEEAEQCLLSQNSHWFYRAGYARGGRQAYGGLTWLDFNQEFEPIDGLKQIVGHTSGRKVRAHAIDGNLDVNDWDNICIDSFLNQYLLITNKKLAVKNYADL